MVMVLAGLVAGAQIAELATTLTKPLVKFEGTLN
jgi:hypothetical protein